MFRFTGLLSLLSTSAFLFGACAARSSTPTEVNRSEPTRPSRVQPRQSPIPGSRSIANAYFRGADRYADRVDECLGANRELDVKAADPSVCLGPEAHVCLVPVGKVRTEVVEAIVRFIKETRGLDVVVLPSIEMRPTMVYPETYQVSEEVVLDAILTEYGVRTDTASTFIGITPIDIRPRDGQYEWMFGARFGRDKRGNHTWGVFSYFRMANVEPYDGSPLTDELLMMRAAKYAARYVALLHYDYPLGDDRNYLNYRYMFGFSDLDSMGINWPVEPPPGP